MILLSRHKVERKERFRFREKCVSILPEIAKQSMASQQMRAAPGEPRRGGIPVELVSSQSSDDFPVQIVLASFGRTRRGVGDK